MLMKKMFATFPKYVDEKMFTTVQKNINKKLKKSKCEGIWRTLIC
jgi:hypothetical protein